MTNKRFTEIMKNLEWQINDARNNVNRAMVDAANDRPYDAEKEMREAIDMLDIVIKQELKANAYCGVR